MSYLLPSFLSFGEEDPLKEISLDTSRHHLFSLSVCELLSITDTRLLLLLLFIIHVSTAGAITLYDMGSEGSCMSRVTSLTQDSITQICCGAALTSDKGLFRPIVSIQTLGVASSSNLHLLAVTKSGIVWHDSNFTTCATCYHLLLRSSAILHNHT